MPSFDVVSELDQHEIANALDQTRREIESRFDFRGVAAKVIHEKNEVTLESTSEFQVRQMLDIIRLKVAKRGIDLVCLDVKDAEVDLAKTRQKILLKEGIDADAARLIQKAIKDSKVKVQSSVQGGKVRVTGKSRDDLQAVIALLRQTKVEVALQFNNFRD
jgi:cyclic-di-GMP-binding protein